MFTGLIREIAEVKNFNGDLLCIKAKHKPNIGDSIAVNGICLTAVRVADEEFCVELSSESKRYIASENLKGKVHIEPAMKLSDRVDGHIVQGHIDAIGVIKSIKKDANALDFVVGVSKDILPLMMPKGSVTVDGVSLTINEIYEDAIRLTIIPHTYKNTLFEKYSIGHRVNIETDMFARYIYNMLHRKKPISWADIDAISGMY